MMKVKLLVLVQGLLLAALCDGRVRSIEPDEESKDMQDYEEGYRSSHEILGTASYRTDPHLQGSDHPGTVHYPPEHGHGSHTQGHSPQDLSEYTEDASAEPGARGIPARTGNWCAYVHKREITVAVACGTEKYIIKSQSPCPNGMPDCQLILYKLSTRPVYRQRQKIFTALLWRCCPGHGGQNCDETVSDGPEDSRTSGRVHPGGPELRHTASERAVTGESQEQNDHDDPSSTLYLSSRENQTEDQNYDYPHSPHDGRQHHHKRTDAFGVKYTAPPPAEVQPNPGLLHLDYLKDLMMSHLQPVLDGFNRTLERLSDDVRGLQRDMEMLRQEKYMELEGGGGGEEFQQNEHELTGTVQQLEMLQIQLGEMRNEMDERLHMQQTTLVYNLTSIKTDLDVKIKRNQKMLQTNLHYLNSSLSEVRQEQENLKEELQMIQTPAITVPSQEQPQENTAVWKAISLLDEKVVNHSVTLSTINEDQVMISQNIAQLQRLLKSLEERVTETDRKYEDRYIEAFLEVDGIKEWVNTFTDNKVKNISDLLEEMEEDMNELYKDISSGSRFCDCKTLGTSVAHLREDVFEVKELADENKRVLDRAGVDSWHPSVEDLKLGLQNVQNSVAFEQDKSRTLQQILKDVQASISKRQMDIEDLQSQNRIMNNNITQLFGKFNSVLQDAIRLTMVLETLLGEEVLVFMKLPEQVREAHSIRALNKSMEVMQAQIVRHSESLASMLNSEDTAADEPSLLTDWSSVDRKRRVGHQKLDHLSGELPDYTDDDFIALEKTVGQLQVQVLQLEKERCSCLQSATPGDLELKLRAELTEMQKNLQDHLRIFGSVFTNIEDLLESEATVDLDKLSALMKRSDTTQKRNRQKKRSDARVDHSGEHVKLRSKRDASLETAVLSQLPDSPLMFLASRRDGVNVTGKVVFETVSLNRGQMYSPKTGTFKAPTAGVYLLVLTLDFGPGPSLAQLKRGEEVAASLHQSLRKPTGPATRVCILQLEQGEELQLEIVQGTLENSNPQDNTFAGLLILQTT
ncbi:multimerin-2a [Hoplias malabaricus]|uniref:multimerin-2a n=1 Tax=Hoplias malabaricus TaxID=27720 RepID=UPI003462FC89